MQIPPPFKCAFQIFPPKSNLGLILISIKKVAKIYKSLEEKAQNATTLIATTCTYMSFVIIFATIYQL
jgi:hypothetical protein